MKLIKKSILKNVAKWSTIFVLSAAIGFGVGSGASYLLSDLGYSRDDYSDEDQMRDLAEKLNCDTSYLSGKGEDYYRLAHNDGAPIPIAFEENYDPRAKKVAIEAMDYMFGMLQDINPVYHYEIVSLEEYKDRDRGVNGIEFSIKTQAELKSEKVEARAVFENADRGANRIIRCEIFICGDRLQESTDEDLFYSYVHEMMHLLGCNDVYLTEKGNPKKYIYNNTIMNTDTMGKNPNEEGFFAHKKITPNDYDNLLVCYSPKCETEEEKQSLLIRCVEKSQKYKNEYYSEFAQMVKNGEDYNTYTFEDCSKIEELIILNNYYKDKKLFVSTKIAIKGDKYTIEYWADEGVFKDTVSCSGEVFRNKDCIVLKNVDLEHMYIFKNFLPYKGDFVLMYTKGKFSTLVIDLYSMDLGLYFEGDLKTSQNDLSIEKNKGEETAKNSNAPKNETSYNTIETGCETMLLQ